MLPVPSPSRERARVRAVSVEGSSPHPSPLPEREGTAAAPAFLPTRLRRVVLWDTRKLDVSKDFAGGFGIGQYCGDGSFRSRVIRRFYKRDRRPSSLLYAYLAAIFARLGHRVEYAEDNLPADADLYVFNPSLLTLPLERETIAALLPAPGIGEGARRGQRWPRCVPTSSPTSMSPWSRARRSSSFGSSTRR